MTQMPLGSEPPPLGYQVARTYESQDAGHLTALSICHYVWGGISILFSSIFIVHIVMGAAILSGKISFPGPVPPPGSNVVTSSPPDALVGWMFVIMGSCVVGIGWTVGILSIFSGVCIARRRKRTFSLVVAGVCCAIMPLGTALGIFTFIVLLRDSVKRMYEARS